MRLFCMCLKNANVFKFNVKLLRHIQISRQLAAKSMTSDLHNSLKTLKPLVGVIQMTSTSDKENNFRQVASLVEKASKRGAQMVFLPENCDYMAETFKQSIELSENLKGNLMTKYKELAVNFNVWLFIGGFHQRTEETSQTNKISNTHISIDSNGNIVATYDKLHLFDIDTTPTPTTSTTTAPNNSNTTHSSDPNVKPTTNNTNPSISSTNQNSSSIPSLKESNQTLAGSRICPPIKTPFANVGLAICYDLRFAELSLIMRKMGAHILTFPSAFTVPTGMAHWEVLLRARAIETQCYVLAPAQVGKHNNKRSSYGHAMIVDPWGTVVAQCPADQSDVCIAEIDLDLVNQVRKVIPVFEHRRDDLYGPILTFPTDNIDGQSGYKFGPRIIIPSSCVFHRTAHSFAFVNKSPLVPGHVLISSLRMTPRLGDLTKQEVADLYSVVHDVSRMIGKFYNATSLTVAMQDGPEAGQTVEHVHVHVLPRKLGDFAQNDDVYDKLEKHDKEMTRRMRSEEEMTKEAAEFRDAMKMLDN